MLFDEPDLYKDLVVAENRLGSLAFGLLSPNRGIEHGLNAWSAIIAEFPQVVYCVLGTTPPNLVREQGEASRLDLERLAKKNGVEQHVIFHNRFIDLPELKDFIGAADGYLTPYLNEQPIVSGTPACAFGAGRAVIPTPDWHAAELLADGRGVLVPFADGDAIAREVRARVRDEPRRLAMRQYAPTRSAACANRSSRRPKMNARLPANVVHSWGALLHDRELIIGNAVSDFAPPFSTVSVDAVLAAME